MEVLHPYHVRLSTVANDYSEGMSLLKGRGSIIKACRYYAEAHGDDIKPIRVQALVDDLIETRKQNHASQRRLDDLRSRLDRFAKSFQCDIHSIRAAQIQAARTRKPGGHPSKDELENQRRRRRSGTSGSQANNAGHADEKDGPSASGLKSAGSSATAWPGKVDGRVSRGRVELKGIRLWKMDSGIAPLYVINHHWGNKG